VAGAGGRRIQTLRMLLVFLLPLGAYLVTLAIAHPAPTGDEPHYLLVAHSLAHDHDLNMANDYANRREVRAVYPGRGPLESATHAYVYHPGGPTVPTHNIGLALLLVPVVALGGSYTAAKAEMCVVAALVLPVLLAVADRLLPRNRRLTVAAVLAVGLSVPFVSYSNQLYPEVPGALLLAVGVWAIVAAPAKRWALVLGCGAAGLLPFFHVRYAVLGAALFGGLVVRAVLEHRGPHEGWALGPAARRAQRDIAVVVGMAITALVALTAYNHHVYGYFSPNAAYHSPPWSPTTIGADRRGLYAYTIGDLLSPAYGVFPYAPVLLLGAAGIVALVRRARWTAAVAVAVLAGYYLLASAFGKGGGYCPPGRFTIVVLPMLAVPLAAALASGRRLLWVFVPLAGYSLLLTAMAATHFQDLYPFADGPSVPVAAGAATAWPSFGSAFSDNVRLTEADPSLAHQVGRVEVAPDGQPVAVAGPGDGPGFIVYGPYAHLRPGTYRADVAVTVLSGLPGQEVAKVELASRARVLATVAVVVGPGLPPTTSVSAYTDGTAIEVRVVSEAHGLVAVGTVVVQPAYAGSVPGAPLSRDLPLTLVWFGVVSFMALLCLGDRPVPEQDTALPPDPAGGPAPAAAPDHAGAGNRSVEHAGHS
jgi:hypothetical protein